MVNVVANFQPFQMEQHVSVYVDGHLVEDVPTSIDNIVNIINGFKSKYSATEIDLIGSADYLQRFQAELNTKFSHDEVKIYTMTR